MFNVLLMGDSICQGYSKYVREYLFGIASVYCPEDNGRFTTYQLKYLNDWLVPIKKEGKVDVVHFNAGLWDCLRIDGDEPLIDKSTYVNNIRRLIHRIRHNCHGADIVLATTTKVINERMDKSFCRLNEDVEIYNECLVEIANKNGVGIDDLYAVTSSVNFFEYDADGIHFTDCGYKKIADKVFESIIKILLSKANFKEKIATEFRCASGAKLNLKEYNRVVVYGYGEYGKYIVRQMNEHCPPPARLLCVIDRNPMKHGFTPEGVPVISLEEYQKRSKSDDVVIVSQTNKKTVYEIKRNLCALNVQMFDIYDFQCWWLMLKGVL